MNWAFRSWNAPEAWGHIMRDYDNVVVCLSGTHGKTTSTSMMTMMTMEAQMDPTVMVGSNLPAIGGTLRIGGKGCFVAESCEYTNSFLRFAPTISVILNVEETTSTSSRTSTTLSTRSTSSPS